MDNKENAGGQFPPIVTYRGLHQQLAPLKSCWCGKNICICNGLSNGIQSIIKQYNVKQNCDANRNEHFGCQQIHFGCPECNFSICWNPKNGQMECTSGKWICQKFHV